MTTSRENPDDLKVLMQRLLGRAEWLEQRGRIKDTELMRDAYAALSMLKMSLLAQRSKQ